MDVRESDILDNSVNAEEDIGNGGHAEEGFEKKNDGMEEISSDESEEDPEYRELEERSQIVEKYERGPEQEVEEWENPDLELYKVTDRYGFMHKDVQEISVQELAEKKRMIKEVSREQKWLRMISRWNDGKDANDKLKKRLWKGIPEKFRSLVWARLLEINRYRQEQKSCVYRELLMRAQLISKDIKQIDLDINRTYRDHLAFRRRYDVKQQSLFNVLAAYAMYNTEVGYCQGMNQIAALFLMYMDEEDAFWCLHALLVDKKHSMHGFFVPGFPKLVRFQTHYERILQKYLPRLKKHLDKAGIPPIYVTKWWFGCFLDRVPFPLALRLWDVFLLEGDVILIGMAYNIMKMHEKTMRKLQMENFMEYIQTVIAQDFGFSDEETIKSLQDCLKKLHGDRMLLPPSPKPGDAPETPTKSFGPVLSRSMIDIRLDIAEIQSRCSRANSVAGRSPIGVRRQRLPPSPTPLSKYKLSQLPSRPMEPVVPENSQSSISSASTVRDTSSREQQQATKVFSDATNNTNLPVRRPESREGSSQLFEKRPAVPAKSIGVKTVRPLIVEEIQDGIQMDERYLPHTNNEGDLESRRQQQQRLPTLPTGQQIRQPNFRSNSPAKATQCFDVVGKQELYALPPEEPPVDYDNTHCSIRPGRSFRSVHPTASTAGFPACITSSSFHRPNDFITPAQNEIGHSHNSFAFIESDHTRSKFRSQLNDDEISQRVFRCTRRGSFYDNVSSVTPDGSSSSDLSRMKLTSDQGCFGSDTSFGVHSANNSLSRRYRRIPNSAVLQDSKPERRIAEIETRVVQLPNNVTCVRVGDTIDNMPSSLQQRQHYNVPVRREVYNTRTVAGHGDYGIRNMDLQLHHRRQYPSNTMNGYSWHDQPHFSMQPNHYERNTYFANDRQSSEQRPLRIRSDRFQYYTDKG